jgi:branched-chain amino acid transport system substrate-binding protein
VIGFRKAYMKANSGSKPNAFSALGYDSANLIMTAISKANSTDPEAVRKSLMAIRNYEGVTGTISYSPGSRIPKKSVTILKIDKGNRNFIKQILPTQVPAP